MGLLEASTQFPLSKTRGFARFRQDSTQSSMFAASEKLQGSAPYGKSADI
jgi:hypothetical protein